MCYETVCDPEVYLYAFLIYCGIMVAGITLLAAGRLIRAVVRRVNWAAVMVVGLILFAVLATLNAAANSGSVP